MSKIPNKREINDYLIDIIQAGLLADPGKVELISLTLARDIKIANPEISSKINHLISSFSLSRGATLRSAGGAPLPVDSDSQLEVATILPPNDAINKLPILSSIINERIESFLSERDNIQLLLDKNIRPSTSLLLIGQPGTGKTMLARYVASALNKNLVILDLSSSISSLMGKTGANLKKVIQYAKRNSCVLLFDEFDAIAKKRNDNTDLGEIKRVVNVLLMELEDWPISSIFIATSNHPELLDKAIWRRFDHTISINVPEKEQRLELLRDELKDFFNDQDTDHSILHPVSELLNGKSAADIQKFCNNVKRRIILKSEDSTVAILHELEAYTSDKKIRAKFCVLLKKMFGNKISVRRIAEITGLSAAGVQHHLSKNKS
jgi:Cdc6-like AAA superfamily ATPase